MTLLAGIADPCVGSGFTLVDRLDSCGLLPTHLDSHPARGASPSGCRCSSPDGSYSGGGNPSSSSAHALGGSSRPTLYDAGGSVTFGAGEAADGWLCVSTVHAMRW